MILYFTGTGNSRFIAQRLAQATGEELLDTAHYIRKGASGTFTQPGRYVFVCPVYVCAPVRAFTSFLRRSSFPSDCRAYFIMNCAGGMGAAPVFCQKLAEEKGFRYYGTAQVKMPQNYLVYFKNHPPEENRAKLNTARPAIDRLAQHIAADQPLPEVRTSRLEYAVTVPVVDLYYRHFMSPKPFTATEHCIGCGKCAKSCPLGNITMQDRRPRWGDTCTHCMACINLCPVEAIEYGRRTKGKLRYHGPESVSENEIL